MQDIKPLLETDIDNWQKATLDELRTEVQNLRRWCGQLFLQVKEWTTRSYDLQQTSEQQVKLHADYDQRYIALEKRLDDLELLMGKTNEADEVVVYDDSPQPNNNLTGNPYK